MGLDEILVGVDAARFPLLGVTVKPGESARYFGSDAFPSVLSSQGAAAPPSAGGGANQKSDSEFKLHFPGFFMLNTQETTHATSHTSNAL